MQLSRRDFLIGGAAVSVGFLGLRSFVRAAESQAATALTEGFGPMAPDPAGVLNLPTGFSYRVISRRGERMDDGFFVPGQADGMAAFPGPDGLTILVRNHELLPTAVDMGPFGPNNELAGRIDPELMYDRGYGKLPGLGGTTTLVYDTRTGRLEKQFLSLAGTRYNCAGGPTPWGTWVSCEENEDRADDVSEVNHGYNFEVPAGAEIRIIKPVPIKAMGRFRHEAVAVDPATGIVYQTEDVGDGLLYRYIPRKPGRLHAGGRLQALALRDHPGADVRNWRDAETGEALGPHIEPDTAFSVAWIDMDEIDSPNNDLRYRGHAAGAARFARNEGMWHGNDAVYFASTSGGPKRKGQVWRYVPSPSEGAPDEASRPGRLELFIQPSNADLVKNADNVTVTPWGDLILCEDAGGDCNLVGVTPDGRCYRLAENALDNGEFAGACFAPDGSTLFVNMQMTGQTLAITGPWPTAR